MGVGVAEGGCEACETVRVVMRWVEVAREPHKKRPQRHTKTKIGASNTEPRQAREGAPTWEYTEAAFHTAVARDEIFACPAEQKVTTPCTGTS